MKTLNFKSNSNIKMSKPKRPKYFTPNEVSIHNTAKDMWVSFLGKVYDLTPFIEENTGKFKLKLFLKVMIKVQFNFF